MSEPIRHDITVYRGGTFTLPVAVTESDDTVADLGGYSGEMQLRSEPTSSVVLDEATVTIDTATGVVTAVLAAANTLLYDFVGAVYDLRIVNGPVIEYIATGRVAVKPTVTA